MPRNHRSERPLSIAVVDYASLRRCTFQLEFPAGLSRCRLGQMSAVLWKSVS